MAKKLTYKEIKKRFIEQGRPDIEICEDGFEGWKKKSKFFDKVTQSYFFSVPKRVYDFEGVHPIRAKERKKQTNLLKYGNACSLHGTTLEAKKVNSKKTKTYLTKYGVSHPSKAEAIKEKKRQTCLQNYNVDNPSKSETIKEKKRQTFVKNYGVEHAFYLQEHKKHLEAKTIKESGQRFQVWYDELPYPKPSISSFYNWSRDLCVISLSDLQRQLDAWEQKKSALECYSETLFESSHYNKKPFQLIDCGFRPDFKLSEHLFVNADGLYWHSEHRKENNYHFNMRNQFEENGIRLMQFYENEIYQSPIIVKSMVQHACKQTINKIGARSCSIHNIEQKIAAKFLKENHLMSSISSKHLGLFYKEKLVSVLSYKSRKNIIKIERFCSQVHTQVNGGFSKLLKHLETNCLHPHITEIHNWVDLRYGTGNHLLAKDFVHSHDTLGWKWTDGENTYNRLRCRANMDSRNLTQVEYANELGWYRVYDAGQRLYIKTLIPSLESS